MKITVGSKNITKVKAFENVAKLYYGPSIEVTGTEAPSGVSPMPLSDEEAIEGAHNRAVFCRQNHPADLSVGMEGSVRITPHGIFMTTWCCVSDDRSGIESLGCGALIQLPKCFQEYVLQGMEIGEIFNRLPANFHYMKELTPIGFLTKNTYTRLDAIEVSAKMALAPIIHRGLYALTELNLSPSKG